MEELGEFDGGFWVGLDICKYLTNHGFVNNRDFSWHLSPFTNHTRHKIMADSTKIDKIRGALVAYKLGIH